MCDCTTKQQHQHIDIHQCLMTFIKIKKRIWDIWGLVLSSSGKTGRFLTNVVQHYCQPVRCRTHQFVLYKLDRKNGTLCGIFFFFYKLTIIADLNSEFSLSENGLLIKAKKLKVSYYLSIVWIRTYWYMLFLRWPGRSETQTTSDNVGTWIALTVSLDDIHDTMLSLPQSSSVS